VDDTTTGATYDNHHLEPIPSSVSEITPEEESLLARIEDIILFLLNLIQVTGGYLTPEKLCMVPDWSPLEKWGSTTDTNGSLSLIDLHDF
jgi:hypothetical protein